MRRRLRSRTTRLFFASPRESKPVDPLDIRDLTELEFVEVEFQHRSASHPALKNVSFTAVRGETIAFVGPSGSGKTTLVKMLVGLYRPLSGEVRYNGVPGSRVDLDGLRERIGLVTQDPQLFSGTIRDNLRFVRPEATDEECLQALRAAAADTLLRRGDKGLDTVSVKAASKCPAVSGNAWRLPAHCCAGPI